MPLASRIAVSLRLTLALAAASGFVLDPATLTAQTPKPPAPLRSGRAVAPAPSVDLSDEGNEGINDVRVENEIKINVPDSVIQPLWAYLNRRYLPRADFLAFAGDGIRTRASDEYFTDVYFDTPDFWFLNHDAGLRHRSRLIPGDSMDRKNGRELMQLKLQRAGELTSRNEIKFDIRHYSRATQPDDLRPALGIVQRSDRPAFLARLQEVGVDGRNVREAMTIHQRRRRVYLFDNGGVFFSLTLDSTTARKWWMRQSFTEIELEINEIAYTGASSQRRRYLETVQDSVVGDLKRAFPQLRQDQTPKYTKMVQGFERDHFLFPVLWRLEMDPSAGTAALTGVLFVGLAVAGGVAHLRRRRATTLYESTA